MLQQTSAKHRGSVRAHDTLGTEQDDDLLSGKTVLQKVFESDMARKETLREIAGKSGFETRSTQNAYF